MKPVFVVGGLYTESSGVARIVCELANAFGQLNSPVEIYTAECNGHGIARHLLADPDRCVAAPGRWLGRLSHSPRLRDLIAGAIEQADLVHNHSLWMLPNHYASSSARRFRKPVVFTAHGALDPWALEHSRWKKRFAGWWFQNRDLRDAACLHVNSRAELESIRSYGLGCPVAVVPNGVDSRAFNALPDSAEFRLRWPATAGKRVALFLSRLHVKKGLDHLLRAWSQLGLATSEWHLVIAGPDDGYESQTAALIETLDLKDDVSLVGPLYGNDKLAAFSAANAFVLPSFSEGFSMAVLEAMAAGLPVVMSTACQFPDAFRQGAAIELSSSVEGTTEGLRCLFAMTDDERSQMGNRGKELVNRDYTWDTVARQLCSLYDWIIGGGQPPEFVDS